MPRCRSLAYSASSNGRRVSNACTSFITASTTIHSPRRGSSLSHMKNVSIGSNPLTPTNTSCGLLAHLLLPPGVVVEVTIYVRGRNTDVILLVIPLHHDLIPCTKSIKKFWFQRPSDNTCVMRFSGDNGVLNIFASWQGIYQGLAARAIGSFGSLGCCPRSFSSSAPTHP